MPRPDLELLPVAYRRIPILAIGKDVYLDTRLIIHKLETLYPSNTLGATTGQERFVEKLLQRYMVEGPVFARAAGLVPVDTAQDPTFNKDRQGFLFKSWSKEELEEVKPDCLNYAVNLFGFFESTILSDGRQWLLGDQGPKLADIEAAWPFEFLVDMQLPPNLISEKQYPRVFAWLARYGKARDQAKAAVPEPTSIDGPAAAKQILGSKFADETNNVQEGDPLNLEKGTQVEIYPADWGTEHRDKGKLIGLTPEEVIIAVNSPSGVEFRIHAPRIGFKVKRSGV